MKDDKKKGTKATASTATPGEQNSTYEKATEQNVKQEVKELNNIGAPGKQY